MIDYTTPQYHLPSIDLLDNYENDGEPIVDETKVNDIKEHIEEIFREMDVPIFGVRTDIGPSVIRYVIITTADIKASFVKGIGRVIDMNLSHGEENIRTTMPTQGVIFVEVPRSNPSIVSLRSLLCTGDFIKSDMELPIALGKAINNEVLITDLTCCPHLIVAGSSWTEIAYAQHAIITSLLYKKRPDELKQVLIDTRRLEFNIYDPIAPLYMAATDDPIITDVGQAVQVIRSINTLMDKRHDLLRSVYARDIKEYNKRFNKGILNPVDGHHYMPYIVVVIFEYADLALTSGREIGMSLTSIAQKAKDVGIHMVIATRRPTSAVINESIKANISGRIAFNVPSLIESQAILDQPGAEKLAGRGDMLFLNDNTLTRAKGAYIDEKEVTRVCKHIAHQPIPATPFVLPEPDDNIPSNQTDNKQLMSEPLDPLFEKAAYSIVHTQKGSIAMLQRQFCFGYNRAGRLMDQLETAGIVGPACGAQPRDVYVTDENELETIIEQLKAKGVLKI